MMVMSPIGEALTMLPAIVARLRIGNEPMSFMALSMPPISESSSREIFMSSAVVVAAR